MTDPVRHRGMGVVLALVAQYKKAKAEVTALREQLAERGNQARKMLAALKIIPVVMRPWIDAQIGHGGTVSFEEWEAAMKQIDAALEAEATQETR